MNNNIVISCGLLIYCVFLSTKYSNGAKVFRYSGSELVDYNLKTVNKDADDDKKTNLQTAADTSLKTIRRNPRCYDKLDELINVTEKPVIKRLKLPAWAGTLYHHRILHPWHDWNNTLIDRSRWDRD